MSQTTPLTEKHQVTAVVPVSPSSTETGRIRLRCPACTAAAGYLESPDATGTICPACSFRFETKEGILHALPELRQLAFARFFEEYSVIRKAEGRGSENADYYLALPFKDLTGNNSGQWAIRGKSFSCLERRVLPKLENEQALDILDLGAGTGWLSYRLAKRNHRPVAVDLLTDSRDGLGAARHFRAPLGSLFPLVAAEFDNLPFADGQFDLAIFNSSLHYSVDMVKTLTEAKRCLKPSGSVIILDSPLYRRQEHGRRMREERHRYFEATYGFRSDSIPSVEFLHDSVLEELAIRVGLRWRLYRPWYGWKWHLRPWQARLRRKRPPSRFCILVGNRA